MLIPTFSCGIREADLAFRIAVGTLTENVSRRFPCGLLNDGGPVILAGLEYEDPWTRDTSFNSWFAGSLLMPDVAKNTLLSVIEKTDAADKSNKAGFRMDRGTDGIRNFEPATQSGNERKNANSGLPRDTGRQFETFGSRIKTETGYFIRGGYWDAIIWVHAAWEFYLRTGDREFLALSHDVAQSALRFYEETELDETDHLFRGGACFMDGISAYPDRFLTHDGASGIYDCTQEIPRPAYLVNHGNGIPCKALSTNCLYYMAYTDAECMRRELGLAGSSGWETKARELKTAIQHRFYDAGRRRWRYLLDAEDPDPAREEGLGHAFLMISGIADDAMSRRICDCAYRTPEGLPCVWPTFERYARLPEKYGRHSGTVWPQVNAAWVLGLCGHGLWREAWPEVLLQAKRTARDFSFFELYHPETGLPFAGLQEYFQDGICRHYPSNHGQTWAATGYIAMIFTLLFGMRFTPEEMVLAPHLPDGVDELALDDLPYRRARLSIHVSRTDDPAIPETAHIPAGSTGEIRLELKAMRKQPEREP